MSLTHYYVGEFVCKRWETRKSSQKLIIMLSQDHQTNNKIQNFFLKIKIKKKNTNKQNMYSHWNNLCVISIFFSYVLYTVILIIIFFRIWFCSVLICWWKFFCSLNIQHKFFVYCFICSIVYNVCCTSNFIILNMDFILFIKMYGEVKCEMLRCPYSKLLLSIIHYY